MESCTVIVKFIFDCRLCKRKAWITWIKSYILIFFSRLYGSYINKCTHNLHKICKQHYPTKVKGQPAHKINTDSSKIDWLQLHFLNKFTSVPACFSVYHTWHLFTRRLMMLLLFYPDVPLTDAFYLELSTSQSFQSLNIEPYLSKHAISFPFQLIPLSEVEPFFVKASIFCSCLLPSYSRTPSYNSPFPASCLSISSSSLSATFPFYIWLFSTFKILYCHSTFVFLSESESECL